MSKRFRKFRAALPHLLLVGLSVVALVLVVVLLWWDIARRPAISESFSYSADTVTSRVFYDEVSGQAHAPQYIKTNLELALEYQKDKPTIRSTLGTETVHGQTHFTRSNQLIDPERGVYLKDSSPTDEFVLAPRGLARGESFTYRHPAFSLPAKMQYEGEERIDGLSVYRYTAHFTGVVSYFDSSVNIDNPVSPNDHLAYTPQLEVWVEPTSGWMVKYFSDVAGRLVDKTSGEDKGLYEKVTEVMSEESIKQHVAYATTQKLKFTFIKQIVPSIMLTALFVLLLAGFVATIKARTVPVYAAVGTVFAISTAIIVGWMMGIEPLQVFFTGPTGINPLTAICFILVALAIAALYKNKRTASAFAGSIVGIFALLQIFGELGITSFSIDLLLFKDAVLGGDPTSARMTIYTAATFLLLAVGLVKASFTSQKSRIHFARFLVGMVFTIGILGLVLKLTRFDKLLTINFVDPFSAIPSLLFVVCALTLLQLFRTLNERPDNILSTVKAICWPAFATLPLVVIGVWTQLERNSVTSETSVSFTSQIATFEKAMNAHISNYVSTLEGARALFGASVEVTADEFHQYVKDYLSKQQPGLDEIGFAPVVTDPGKQNIEKSQKGLAEIFPKSQSRLRTPISYLETFTSDDNRHNIGYDLSSDEVLRDAMLYARDTGKTIMSKQTASLQKAEDINPRVFIFHPVYKNGVDVTTTAQRRQALEGYVFVVADASQLLGTVTPKSLSSIDVSVYDGVGTRSESLLYTRQEPVVYVPKIQETRTLFITNRPWTFTYSAQPGFESDSLKHTLPSLIFFGGSMAYFAALSIAYFIARQGIILKRTEPKKQRDSDF